MGPASPVREARSPISLANKRFSVHGLLPVPGGVTDIVGIAIGPTGAVRLHSRVRRDGWCLTWTGKAILLVRVAYR